MFIALIAFVLLSSHDLFFKTHSYFLKSNENSELFLVNGTFEKSENPITRDRITDARIIGPDYEFIPNNNDWYDKDNISYLKFKTGKSGTYVAGVSTLPNMIELTADEFNEYLEHDGLLDVLAERKKDGEMDKPSKEKYAKHVKILLQILEKKTNQYNAVFNYPVEFVPKSNPYEAKPGDKITFILLKNSRPLPDHLVYIGSKPASADIHEPDHGKEETIRTNKKGEFKIRMDHSGIWYLRTIDMVKSENRDADYVSNWATLTFEIR
jgi:hypothetical protein